MRMSFLSLTIVLSFFTTLLLSSVKSSEFNNPLESEIDVRNQRIIGGRNTFDGERPFQVAIGIDRNFVCGESLIAPKLVLTAAHCVSGVASQSIIVRYNTLDYRNGPTTDVSRVIIHENYDNTILLPHDDIALLVLSSKFHPDTNAKIIKISRSSDPMPGSSVTVSGWGSTAVVDASPSLKAANLTVFSNNECQDKWDTAATPVSITSSMICSSDSSTASGCSGDSGGPVTSINPFGITKLV